MDFRLSVWQKITWRVSCRRKTWDDYFKQQWRYQFAHEDLAITFPDLAKYIPMIRDWTNNKYPEQWIDPGVAWNLYRTRNRFWWLYRHIQESLTKSERRTRKFEKSCLMRMEYGDSKDYNESIIFYTAKPRVSTSSVDLSSLEPGKLPLEVFNAIARVTVTHRSLSSSLQMDKLCYYAASGTRIQYWAWSVLSAGVYSLFRYLKVSWWVRKQNSKKSQY